MTIIDDSLLLTSGRGPRWNRKRYTPAMSAELRLERAERWRVLTPDPFIADDGSVTHFIPLFGARNYLVGFCRVTADDLEMAQSYRWGTMQGGYIAATDRSTGTQRAVFLHRLVLGLTHGDRLQGDHINGDVRDCTRANLRILSQPQNAQNRKSHGSSPFRGVHRRNDPRAQRNPWVAVITIDRKQVNLGHFATEQEAAEVARAARRVHMPFAVERD